MEMISSLVLKTRYYYYEEIDKQTKAVLIMLYVIIATKSFICMAVSC